MDLAEKRRQLEAVRAARQAKQQVVEQYMTDHPSNNSRTANTSRSSSVAALLPMSAGAVAAAVPSARSSGASARPSLTAISTPVSPPSSLPSPSSTRAVAGAVVSKRDQFSAGAASGPLTPPPEGLAQVEGRRTASSRATAALPSPVTAAGIAKAPLSPSVRAAQKPHTPSSVSTQTLFSPLNTPMVSGAASPLIQVLAVSTPPAAVAGGVESRPTPAGASKTPPGSAGAAAGRQPPTSTVPISTKHISSARGGADDDAHHTKRVAAPVDARLDRRGGWSALQHCMRGGGDGGAAREFSSERPTRPVCIFNPAVVLGDVAESTGSSRRRVVLDATACLVPYEGAVGLLGHPAEGENDSTIWSVCVAATYGAKNSLFREVASGGDYPAASSAARRGSLESAVVGTDTHSGRGVGAGGSTNCMGRSAEAALKGIRASMECGYLWGSASATQTTVPGNTMDAALRVARESPGLVLAWFVVPLPANTVPRREGTLYAEASTSGSSASHGTGAAVTASQADYVVVVVPLVCDSEVTTLLAHPFQPSTLLGGTRCGRIVQWSMGQAWAQVEPCRLIERALTITGTTTTLLLPPQRPIHSSFPSPQAHQAPVLRMAIHGDISCHHLYSISQEGKVCTWAAWQPSHPTASCLSYLGIRPMGSIGVAAQFVERPGTDAMTQVFIGTSSGALLVGANRDARSIELQYYGPPRQLPTSSTVIKTLDVTASPPTAAAVGNHYTNTAAALGAASPTAKNISAECGIVPGGRDLSGALTEDPNTAGSRSGNQSGLSGNHRSSLTLSSTVSFQQQGQQLLQPQSSTPSLPPLTQPHHGRIVSMSLQTATHGFRDQDCVVSAATDGTCAAWFQRSAIPLEGFSSAVTSVCWSPTKPGVLAAGDSSGLVTVWAVNESIITPAGTVSLREASRRTRGSATADAVLWVVAGPSDAAGLSAGGVGSSFFGGVQEEDDDADLADDGDAAATLKQADAIGVTISSLFFSRDGRWLFASTACGYIYSMRLHASLA